MEPRLYFRLCGVFHHNPGFSVAWASLPEAWRVGVLGREGDAPLSTI